MVNTCPFNANAHPGLVAHSARKKKCTREEIKWDEAQAKADTIAAREAAAASQHENLKHIAAIEDSIQQEDDAQWAHANRPDLHFGLQSSNTTLSTRDKSSETNSGDIGEPGEHDIAGYTTDKEDEGTENDLEANGDPVLDEESDKDDEKVEDDSMIVTV
ncbi:hypothetical protein EI94DRAFT_1814429 [Lactarius quietus]|nr:hypothetical protein EI94DRAFT_1814429 [Lactarius quietus]